MKTRVNICRRSCLGYLHEEELKWIVASLMPDPGHSLGGDCEHSLLQNQAGTLIRRSNVCVNCGSLVILVQIIIFRMNMRST